ncbi:MAG: hypothetical protein GY778_23855 [bacterium]|nr:hypothetical protein [bacterium]
MTEQPALGGTIIGQLTDAVQPACEGFVDILSASIEQGGGQLTFAIDTRQDIPTSMGPNEHLTFLWLVDADNDPLTGQPHQQLGSEFNVRAVVSPTFGGGYVDVTGALPGGGLGEVTILGNRIEITIFLGQIADPDDFHWSCDACHAVDNVAVSANYETAVTTATTLPYTAPARVTVVTPLLMLSPSGPATGQLQVEVRDIHGDLMPIGDYRLTFSSSNDAVASVDANGLVTAHNVPVAFNDTPVVQVSADGMVADNNAIIRVTNTDLGVTHQSYSGTYVSFHLPTVIEGVDLEAITTSYQVVLGTDLAYLAQWELMDAVQFGGGRHYFVLDVSDDPVTVPCGLSGNPVRLGWEYGQPIHNSCYIVNVPQHRVPQWGVIFHEMGHNFTWRSWSFGQFCSASDTHGWVYSEALASMAGAWSWYRLNRCPSGMSAEAVASIAEHFPNIDPAHRMALINYQNAGAIYADATPEVICDILWEMYDDFGPKVWYDLYSTFVPYNEPLPLQLVGDTDQATWLVAALSASSGQDLRSRFAADYGFPIADSRWAEMLGAVQTRIDARSWQAPALGDLDCDGDADLGDFSMLADCLDGPASTAPLGCHNADLDEDGDVDLADFAQFQSLITMH